jgi:exodeoxyribonuclease VII large subunit
MPDSNLAPATNLPELSVSDIAHAVKRTRSNVVSSVRGELSRVTIAKSGHLYVDLKDENAVLNVVMWKGAVSALKFRPAEGLEVICEGKLSSFAGKSSYQLIAERMEPAGQGALLAQLERLKAKLNAEGLFDPAKRKPLPFLPETIGVVTSPTGAVIRDILHRLGDRFPRRVLLWPVLVQGEHAAAQVAAAIKGFNAQTGALRPDVLIVARGGGSLEDLWAFNEEIVVRAAADSKIPLISAIGHETDTTLIDFAADRRAPTPTGAAEMVVPVRAELIERVEMLSGRLGAGLVRGQERKRIELRAVAVRLPRPEQVLQAAEQRFDRAAEKLGRGLQANTLAARARFDRIAGRLQPQALARDAAQKSERLGELSQRLRRAVLRVQADEAKRLTQLGRMLDSLSHKKVLARGFALVQRPDGGLVRAAGGLASGEAIQLTFADGAVGATIGEAAPGGAKAKAKPRKGGADQGSLF